MHAAVPFERGDYVQVTNGTDEPIEGRFAGIDYRFPVNEAVGLPILAARHIFGFGMEDKTAAILRLGWANLSLDPKSDGKKLALARLTKIKFEELPSSVLDFKSAARRPQLAHAGTPASEDSEAGGERSSPAEDFDDDVFEEQDAV